MLSALEPKLARAFTKLLSINCRTWSSQLLDVRTPAMRASSNTNEETSSNFQLSHTPSEHMLMAKSVAGSASKSKNVISGVCLCRKKTGDGPPRQQQQQPTATQSNACTYDTP